MTSLISLYLLTIFIELLIKRFAGNWILLESIDPNLIAMFTVYKHSFCYSNVLTIEPKELFVSTANRLLVDTLISIGDVTQNIAIKLFFTYANFVQYHSCKCFGDCQMFLFEFIISL